MAIVKPQPPTCRARSNSIATSDGLLKKGRSIVNYALYRRAFRNESCLNAWIVICVAIVCFVIIVMLESHMCGLAIHGRLH